MARIGNRVEPQWMDLDSGGGGGIHDLYATLGSRVADLPGYGTEWGSFAELGEMQYEQALAERRTIPEAAAAAPLAAAATPSVVPQAPDLSGQEVRLTPPLGLPNQQLPLDVARTSALPPPPPPLSSSASSGRASEQVAGRGGIDRATAQRHELERRQSEVESARQASTSPQSGMGARPRPSQAGGSGGDNEQRGGTSYTVSVHELGAERWSSAISPEQIGRQLYRNAARAQGLSDAQAEAFTSHSVGIPHVFDESGRVRQMQASDLDNRRIMNDRRNTNRHAEYNAIVPETVLAAMREFRQQSEAGVANPVPVIGGVAVAETLPRLAPAGGAAVGTVSASGVLPLAGIATATLLPIAVLTAHYGPQIADGLAANERARVLPPPPPLWMTQEDEPPLTTPTDTAGRAQQQPRVRVAPEGGESLARPTGTTPTSAAPTTSPNRPLAPRQAPQPPQLPPVDLDRLIPTALTAASLARLAQQRQQQPPARVAQPGDRPDLRDTYITNADVPVHYRSDSRFQQLASDPDHGGRVSPKTRAEAMAGLESERQGLVSGIRRGPRGIEFYDASGQPWDVKAPPSPKPGEVWRFNAEQSGRSILDELRNSTAPFSGGTRTPPGTFPHSQTGQPVPRRVILDSTYMTPTDHQALWQWLNQNLTPEELSRIVEVNTRP